MLNLRAMSDEKIVEHIRAGNKESAAYLVEKYSSFVESIAKKYYIPGAEHEDIVQEGLIGFYEAVKGYHSESPLPFQNFAFYCIQKNIFDAIQMASRQKRQALNEAISLDSLAFRESDNEGRRRVIDQIIHQRNINPEDTVVVKSMVKEIVSLLAKLEKKVMHGYLGGKSYQEISKETGKSEKAIGNALQRARSKIKNYFLQEVR